MSNVKTLWGRLAGFVATLMLVALAASTVRAQDISCKEGAEFPCHLDIPAFTIDKAPPVFQLQAPIAQAKLPVAVPGDKFQTVIIKLLLGDEVVCVEELSDVTLADSVLNLEIGLGMSCDFDRLVATHGYLAFQICLEGQLNCLKPLPLPTTPYAVRTTYAVLAAEAQRANVATRANYAWRATADRDMLVTNQVRVGYFEFHNHPSGEAANLYSSSQYKAYEDGGFVQWTPVRNPNAYNLHITAKNAATDRLEPLEELIFAAAETEIKGDVTVIPPDDGQGLLVTGKGANVDGYVEIDGDVMVTGELSSEGLLTITGGSEVQGKLAVWDGLTVGSSVAPALDVTGTSSFNGGMSVAGVLSADAGLEVTGTMTAGGLLTLAQATVNSSLDIDQEVTLGDLDSTTVTVSGTATMPGLVTTGDASVGGDATITGELDVTGPVTFHGHVVFEGGASAGDDTPSPKYLLAEDEDRDVEFLGGAEIAGGISLGGDLDLQFNQLLNARFPVADAAPAGCGPEASGYVYLNTSLDSLMLCSGGEYVQLGGVWECGNANVEPLEGCDDSNAVPGDGCSATCMVEHGWICDPTTVQPTSCNTLCGDGKKASVEPCDDGNDGELDGCRNDCSVMPGWTCAGVEPSVCGATECGDGIWAGDEACDDGDQNDNNGCRNDCTIMDGWECENVHGQASQCEPPCGDGTLGQNEQCDDGDKDNGDGCSANCAIEAGYVCLHSPMPSKCWKNTCGDGKRYTNEECDDDDTSGGDGCSSGCQIEQWWNCSGSLGQKSQCQAICGDSHVVGGQEECDDGNGSGGDGCNGSCNEEDGWNCSGAGPGTCSPICGDGKKKGNEQCDDGDGYSGDGCSSLCQQENGWTCNSPTNHSPFGVPVGPGSVCSAGCGNMNMGSEITAVMFDSKCYWVFKRNTNFKQAAFQCATMNGVLASPKSQLAQDALTQALGGQNGWLGFHQQTWNSGAGTDNGGAWTDGKGIYAGEGNHAGSWNFQLWNEMPPGNYGPDDCSWTQNGTWYSGHCTNTTRYVTCQSK